MFPTNPFLRMLCLLLAMTGQPALALDPNSMEPIEVESDLVIFDDQKGFSKYSGNVIVKQGKTRLEADEIMVRVVNRQIVSIDATGKPAHFVDFTQRETHGYAEAINYVTKTALLTLHGHAKLNQQDHFFSGDKILYDTRNKAVQASGNKSEGERVRIQFQPANRGDASTDTPDATDPAKPSQP